MGVAVVEVVLDEGLVAVAMEGAKLGAVAAAVGCLVASEEGAVVLAVVEVDLDEGAVTVATEGAKLRVVVAAAASGASFMGTSSSQALVGDPSKSLRGGEAATWA